MRLSFYKGIVKYRKGPGAKEELRSVAVAQDSGN